MQWRIEFVNAAAAREGDELPADLRAKFLRIVELLERFGVERVREPYVKHLQGKLWEMRMSGRAGIARSVYVTATERRVVVLHSFVKKSQKTPRAALETALRRAKEAKLI
jgi:phage-related protein